MVSNIFLDFIYSVVSTILSPISDLADVSLPGSIASGFTNARGFLHAIDFVVPYTTLLGVIGFLIGIEVAILTYKVVYWLIKRIPTQS
jgi:hypothetical protein